MENPMLEKTRSERTSVIGIGATAVGIICLLYPLAVACVQSKTREAQRLFDTKSGTDADWATLHYWQNLRGEFVSAVGTIMLCTFIAGLVAIFAFKGWKRLLGVALIVLAIVSSIPFAFPAT